MRLYMWVYQLLREKLNKARGNETSGRNNAAINARDLQSVGTRIAHQKEPLLLPDARNHTHISAGSDDVRSDDEERSRVSLLRIKATMAAD